MDNPNKIFVHVSHGIHCFFRLVIEHMGNDAVVDGLCIYKHWLFLSGATYVAKKVC